MFDRKIIYLHRYEGETDKGNAGYIKQERRDNTCSFLVVLMNLPPEYTKDTELQVFPSGQALCKVHINAGQGHGMALYEEKQLEDMGFGNLPICVAKTQYSLTDDQTKLGAPTDFEVTVRNLKVSAGAGFIVALTGAIMTMPGLPKVPAAVRIDVDETGKITGLF